MTSCVVQMVDINPENECSVIGDVATQKMISQNSFKNMMNTHSDPEDRSYFPFVTAARD